MNPPRPPEVLHCLLSVAMGGLETMVLNLAAATDRRRYEPRVVCLQGMGDLEYRFRAAGIPVETIDRPDSGGRGTLASLARYLRQRRPAVLHTHNRGAHQQGAFARRLASVPAHVHTRHDRTHATTWKARLLERAATRWTDAIVAVSADAAEVARERDLAQRAQLHLISNGVDLRHFSPDAAQRRGNRVVHVARLDPVKDQATLLQAAAIVARARPDFRLDIVGDGPSRSALEDLASTLQLTGVVVFHGMQQDVRPYLSAADLFVLSSRSEGMPMTLLEAMAAGLPAVATDVGGCREVISPGVTGHLVAPEAPEELADRILGLLVAPTERQSMGAAARERIQASYSLGTMAQRYMSLYDTLLGTASQEAAA